MARYIDEDVLINQIEKAYCEPCEAAKRDYNHVRCRACEAEDMLDWIVDAPTADVAPVVYAEWLEIRTTRYNGSKPYTQFSHVCSNCALINKRRKGWDTKFCPNCGARMDR